MKKKVLLIAGQKRSGKDTLATLVSEEMQRLGKTVEIMSFAYPMKKILAVTLGITDEELDALKNDPANPHRGYLQRLGTEGAKPWFGDDVWSQLALKATRNSDADVIIFADFRFPEEGRGFPYEFETSTLKVYRPSLKTDNNDNHISERALDDYEFDYEVNNSSDLQELKASAIEVAHWLL